MDIATKLTELEQSVWYHAPKLGKLHTDEKLAHKTLFEHVRSLENDQRDIHIQNIFHSKLYTNREPMAFEWDSEYYTHFRPINANVENLIQSVLDTLEARIGTIRLKATILSRGGLFNTYMKARRLDRFMWGEFVHHKVHPKMRRMCLDAMIYGDGYLKVDIDEQLKEVYVERVNPDEIIVDQRECISCPQPMQLHHRKLVSKLWLLRNYGKKDQEIQRAILEATNKEGRYTSYRTPAAGQAVLIESWKLPTYPGAGDGRHVICVENATLVDEEYTRDRFPFVRYQWAEPQTGYYGRSLVSDLVGYQIRQNDMNTTQQLGMDLMCVPRIFAEVNDALSVEQLDNGVAKVIRYRGTMPEAMTWSAFTPEFYAERDRNAQRALNFAGVSNLSSQAQLPSQTRLDSSEAIREVSAVEDGRFASKIQMFEDTYKDLASHLIEMNSILYSKYKVNKHNTYTSRYIVDEIDWSEVQMDQDCYLLEVSASSILNMSNAAREDKLNNWFQLGLIDAETYKAYSGNPDWEHMTDLIKACYDYTEYHIQRMFDGDETVVPDPLMDLNKSFHMVHDTYQHLRCLKKVPDRIIDIFVAWLENAKPMMSPATPTGAEGMAQAQGLVPPGSMAQPPMAPGMPSQGPGY